VTGLVFMSNTLSAQTSRSIDFIDNNTYQFIFDSLFDENVTITGNLNIEGSASGSGFRVNSLLVESRIDYIDSNVNIFYRTYVNGLDANIFRSELTDFNSTLIFEKGNFTNDFNAGYLFWDGNTGRPDFLINLGGAGRASTFDGSVQIGKDMGTADLNREYSECVATTLADCNTLLTGADLIVEDDIENFGSTQVHENLIVDENTFVNLSYGSMFQFEQSTLITILVTGIDVNINNMTLGENKSFDFLNAEALVTNEAGVYSATWSLSITNGNKRTFRSGIAINDVLQEPTASSTDTVASVVSNMAGTGLVSLSEDDVITLVIANLDTTENVNLEYANLSLVRIGS